MLRKYLKAMLILTLFALIAYTQAADTTLVAASPAMAGVTVSPTSGLITSEAGTGDTFTVVLDAQPISAVTIMVGSDDSSEGRTNIPSMTFTPTNWATARVVTVAGNDDDLDDGDQAYTIVVSPTISSDPAYNGTIDPSDVQVINTDDDQAGIEITPTSGFVTNESGSTDSFTVVLESEPTADVSMAINSADTTEGTVSPSSVTFTSGNWDTPQLVTITGVDDFFQEGDVMYDITLAPASSLDTSYDDINPPDLTVTNQDNDVAGVTVSDISDDTSEDGDTASFTVVLNSEPRADVNIGVSSSDTSEGTVPPNTLSFNATNWETPQTVIVTGVDDDEDDGNVNYSIELAPATSGDPFYSGIDPSDVAVVNVDNGDAAGITVNPTSGLTTEEDGTQDTFTIVLNTEPVGTVTIALSSSDTTEGTVSPASVTFNGSNWNTLQTVTVTGVDDAADDGDVDYSIVTAAATGSDSNYSGLNAADVAVTNINDDFVNIVVSPVTGLATDETGAQDTFTIVLASMPTASVTIDLSSSDIGEGTVLPTSVTFSAANWDSAQTVTVTGVDDAIADGLIGYTIETAPAVSGDSDYSGLNADDVAVSNADNDTADIIVTAAGVLATEEDGTQATFTIQLDSEPTADVTIALSSSDVSEGTVEPASVTFTDLNWDTPQTVTVTGVDDDVDDGSIAYMIVIGGAVSSDSNYSGLNPDDLAASNADDDTANIIVTPTSGLATAENGSQATFTIRLDSQPTANVSIALSSSDTSEGTVAPTFVTFTVNNWENERTITITGQDDLIVDPDSAYQIITAPATSADSKYSGLNAPNVNVINQDDDTANAIVSPAGGLVTQENGNSAEFTIVLVTQPSSSVTFPVSSNDITEGQATVSSLTFTTANWDTPQTVTVVGNNDDVDDDDQSYTIVIGAASSSDPDYNNQVDPLDVTVTNEDDDTAGISVSAISGDTDESGATATFTVVLDSQPIANVTIGVSSSNVDEGSVSPTSLTFTAANWDTPRTVTVTGVDDDLDIDGDQAFTIILAAATSSDGKYNGTNPTDVPVINRDGDSNVFMPLLQTATPPITQESEPNDTRENATGSLTSGVAVSGGFSGTGDQRDYFYIEHGLGGDVTVSLSNIPSGHDYDLFLRLEDGTLIAQSRNFGTADETISVSNLPANRYFIEVLNFSTSTGGQYTLVVDY